MFNSVRAIIARVRALGSDRRGISAMEFGIVVPAVVIIVTGTYDLGNLITIRSKIDDALHAGGIYAMSYPTDISGMEAAITAAVPSGWTTAGTFTVTTPTVVCSCWATGGAVTTSDCNASPICPTDQVNQRFVTLTATQTYEPLLLPKVSFNSVSSTYVVRVQ